MFHSHVLLCTVPALVSGSKLNADIDLMVLIALQTRLILFVSIWAYICKVYGPELIHYF
jgi:hypothetical protein